MKLKKSGQNLNKINIVKLAFSGDIGFRLDKDIVTGFKTRNFYFSLSRDEGTLL